VHGIGVYSVRVGPKSPALERFPDIKKKKKIIVFVLLLQLMETIGPYFHLMVYVLLSNKRQWIHAYSALLKDSYMFSCK
jgi:hypothetical protein